MKPIKLLVFVATLFAGSYYGNAQTRHIYTIAGTGQYNSAGDGGPAINASFKRPRGVWKDSYGNLYVTEIEGYRIRKIDTTGNISTIVGTGVLGSTGVGGLAVNAQIGHADDVWVDSIGNIYFGDGSNSFVRKIDTMGYLHTIAGNGTWSHTGDGGDASLSTTGNPETLCPDVEGNLIIACPGIIRKIDHATNIITTVAGTGTGGYTGDGGPAINAEVPWYMGGVITDASGNLYFADYGNDVIRKVDVNGIITTFAGTAVNGFSGDGGPAINAQFDYPYGLAIDANGNLLVSDLNNFRIRKIDLSTSIITTIAGGGADTTEGANALTANIGTPSMMYVDTANNIFFANDFFNKIKVIKHGPTTVALTTKQENVYVYPNPATDDLTIKTEKQYTTYTISNSLGQVLLQRTLDGKETEVNTSSLAPGIYYISLEGEQGMEVRKFVKM